MTDYADLKRRLGDAKRDWPEFGYDRTEAAAAIAALEAEVARLREELSLIAVMGYGANDPEHEAVARLAVNRARAALSDQPAPHASITP